MGLRAVVGVVIPVRFYLYAAAAALIGYLLWREHSLSRKLTASRYEVSVLQETLTVEREARAHEQKIAKEASDGYQKELARIRTADDLGPVRLCKRAQVPKAAPSAATPGPDAASPGHVEEPDALDIGPALSDFVEDCEANAAQLNSLQSWILSR